MLKIRHTFLTLSDHSGTLFQGPISQKIFHFTYYSKIWIRLPYQNSLVTNFVNNIFALNKKDILMIHQGDGMDRKWCLFSFSTKNSIKWCRASFSFNMVVVFLPFRELGSRKCCVELGPACIKQFIIPIAYYCLCSHCFLFHHMTVFSVLKQIIRYVNTIILYCSSLITPFS